jgi:hypothetical protein
LKRSGVNSNQALLVGFSLSLGGGMRSGPDRKIRTLRNPYLDALLMAQLSPDPDRCEF